MKYGHKDKKTGIELNRYAYAEQFAEPGDIKTNYMIGINGDIILEGENPKLLAKQVLDIIDRLYKIQDFLSRKNNSRPTHNSPTGDK